MLSGNCYLSMGELDRAIETLGEAVEIERAHSGQLSEWTLLAVDRLASALQRAGRLDEAEGFFVEALEGQSALRGPRSDAAAVEHNNLGNVLLQKGELDGAEPHLRAALEILAESPAADAATGVTLRANLAMLLLRQERLDEAGIEVERALSGIRAVAADHPLELAQTLNSVGLVRLAQQDFTAAETALAEAVSIYDRLYEDPDVYAAAADHNLGSALIGGGRAAEALPRLERAVASMERMGLADHPNTARFRATLAKAQAAGSGSD
jgi:tetratricopeptide (TPR) repeat protein